MTRQFYIYLALTFFVIVPSVVIIGKIFSIEPMITGMLSGIITIIAGQFFQLTRRY